MHQSQVMSAGQQWAKNLPAAIVLFLVAMPLNLGVAIASGVPCYLGIVSGAIGAIVVGIMSGAPLMVSGPDAGIGVLVLEMIKSNGIEKLGIIVLLAGILQLTLGLLRGANWFRAISPAVVNGMLGGMGLIIILTQFHIMLDDTPKQNGLENLLLVPAAILKGLTPADGLSHHPAACVGLLTITVALLWGRCAKGSLKKIPGALAAVVSAAAITALLDLPIQLVSLPTNMLGKISILNFAELPSAIFDRSIWLCAATLAFVISAQSLITATAIDNAVKKQKCSFDKELIAQGTGNILCGLLGALPVAGVLLRSMANLQSGATCRTANIMHGILMICVVLIVPWVLNFVPTCSLAAILVLTGCRMVSGINANLKGYARPELFVFFTTVFAIMLTNLFTGLVIGFAVAVIKELMAIAHLGIKISPMDACNRMVLELWGPATFLQIPRLTVALDSVSPGTELHVRLDEVTYIDHACLELLMDWGHRHRERGGEFVIDWGPWQAKRIPAPGRRRRVQQEHAMVVSNLHNANRHKDAV